MPRERVVFTPEDSAADRQAHYRRGFVYIGIGTAFDLAAAVLIVVGQWPAGVAAAVVGILIALLAAREFSRAARA